MRVNERTNATIIGTSTTLVCSIATFIYIYIYNILSVVRRSVYS